jgi:uncharacterized protein YfaA (DUF2138 family)
MVAENPVLLLVQHAAADEAKIRHILFRLPGIHAPAVAAAAKLQRHRAEVSSGFGAVPKARQTSPEDRP